MRDAIEREIELLSPRLRDALLLTASRTYAESADALGVTQKELLGLVQEAKRQVAEAVLGGVWADPETMGVAEMYIDGVAIELQKRRESVWVRVTAWVRDAFRVACDPVWRSAEWVRDSACLCAEVAGAHKRWSTAFTLGAILLVLLGQRLGTGVASRDTEPVLFHAFIFAPVEITPPDVMPELGVNGAAVDSWFPHLPAVERSGWGDRRVTRAQGVADGR